MFNFACSTKKQEYKVEAYHMGNKIGTASGLAYNSSGADFYIEGTIIFDSFNKELVYNDLFDLVVTSEDKKLILTGVKIRKNGYGTRLRNTKSNIIYPITISNIIGWL